MCLYTDSSTVFNCMLVAEDKVAADFKLNACDVKSIATKKKKVYRNFICLFFKKDCFIYF